MLQKFKKATMEFAFDRRIAWGVLGAAVTSLTVNSFGTMLPFYASVLAPAAGIAVPTTYLILTRGRKKLQKEEKARKEAEKQRQQASQQNSQPATASRSTARPYVSRRHRTPGSP